MLLYSQTVWQLREASQLQAARAVQYSEWHARTEGTHFPTIPTGCPQVENITQVQVVGYCRGMSQDVKQSRGTVQDASVPFKLHAAPLKCLILLDVSSEKVISLASFCLCSSDFFLPPVVVVASEGCSTSWNKLQAHAVLGSCIRALCSRPWNHSTGRSRHHSWHSHRECQYIHTELCWA